MYMKLREVKKGMKLSYIYYNYVYKYLWKIIDEVTQCNIKLKGYKGIMQSIYLYLK